MDEYSKNLSTRLRLTSGYCAICRSYSKLTKDHCPPKKCNNYDYGKLDQLLPKDVYPIKYSNGVTFNTICSTCNNDLLGAKYDPALIEMFEQVEKVVNSFLVLPASISLRVQTNKIARSIVGHLLAVRGEQFVNNNRKLPDFDEQLKEYFLDEQKTLPNNIEIFYWLYPYSNKVFVKHAGFSLTVSPPIMLYGHWMKFKPIAFWVVHNESNSYKFSGYKKLVDNEYTSIEYTSDLIIDLRNIPPSNAPLQDNSYAMFNGSNTAEAIPSTQVSRKFSAESQK